MAKYRKISPRFWLDKKVRKLSTNGKLAFLFMLTNPAMTPVGALPAFVQGLAPEIGLSPRKLKNAIGEIQELGSVKIDEEAGLYWFPSFLKHNRPENPNVIRSWLGSFEDLPECDLRDEILIFLENYSKSLGKNFLDAFYEVFDELLRDVKTKLPKTGLGNFENPNETLSGTVSEMVPDTIPRTLSKPFPKPFANGSRYHSPNQEQEQEQEQEVDLPLRVGCQQRVVDLRPIREPFGKVKKLPVSLEGLRISVRTARSLQVPYLPHRQSVFPGRHSAAAYSGLEINASTRPETIPGGNGGYRYALTADMNPCVMGEAEIQPSQEPEQAYAESQTEDTNMDLTGNQDAFQKVLVKEEQTLPGMESGVSSNPSRKVDQEFRNPSGKGCVVPDCPHRRIVELYHKILPELPSVRVWDKGRESLLKARWREGWMSKEYSNIEEGLQYWKEFFGYVRKCSWLMGKIEGRNGRCFTADFTWLIKPTNFTKIVEGRYEDR